MGSLINQAFKNAKKENTELQLCESAYEACEDTKAVVIGTEWNEFRGIDLLELKSLLKEPIVLDTKNILSIKKLNSIGFSYDNVGRKGIS